MTTHTPVRTFQLAPMSPMILIVTLVLLMLPVGLFMAAMTGVRLYLAAGFVVTAIYAWIWLRFRPTHFVIREQAFEVMWPLKHRVITRNSISNVRLLDQDGLKQEIGWGMRVGAGGLGGGFGWLWTKRRGIVQMYVSRTDRFVWIDCKNGRPWLITPEHPDDFVRVLLGN
jgi:Bacterial PH domain